MSKVAPQSQIALFALGFRPFFIAALAMGLVHIAYWVVAFAGGRPVSPYYGPIGWHSHEMLFGYTLAVVAGFLLTAVRNWTGLPTPTGPGLMVLVVFWLAGRLAPLLPLPGMVIALLDLGFPLLLVGAIARPILKARQARNIAFPVMLFLIAAANLLVHLEALGLASGTARTGTNLMLYVVLMMIVVIFGRIFPFFAGRVLPQSDRPKWMLLEFCCVAALIAVYVGEFLSPGVMTPLCLVAAGLHILRLIRFYPAGLWGQPLLWVLFLGYAWLPIGFLLRAAAGYGHVSPFVALHALTAGCIGVLTLGMMVRVSLGHTGRPLKPNGLCVAAFAVLNLAVFCRTVLPVLWPADYLLWIKLAGVVWAAAFALCTVVLTPVLLRPRPDGKPG